MNGIDFPAILGALAILAAVRWIGAFALGKPAPGLRAVSHALGARGGGDEEERMRKFLEALGLPVEPSQQAPPRRETPPPLRPAQDTRRPSTPPPVPPVVARPLDVPGLPKRQREWNRREEEQQRQQQRKQRKQQRPPRLPAEPPSLDELDAPTRPVSQIELKGLNLPEEKAFETVSSQVSAIPWDTPAVGADARSKKRKKGAGGSGDLRSLLRSTGGLRTAFLVREILGPPRGLQSGADAPSFRLP